MTLDLLRFTTAGSVDDGKSTLIGRLLYDSKQVFEDQLEHVAQASVRRGGEGALDLALLTDGLRAEREQGITIDVAYLYFATAKRRFITLANSYHGETLGALAVGNVQLYKDVYQPLLMDVITVHSPDGFGREPGETEPASAPNPSGMMPGR